ncbi:relaxase/mobilization nuclease domain-containing protein [Limosilactobacillus coleohominis]|uniref:relaxase/mobilization nuclease domain-containing protein n=1 Tax=Limosilactobacillus coleohominis TaxID=181675 RepID=UPI00195EA354|nr:relaxase/mobilization nuclease domain-containing protein [Limosilactobacillus coleohominis]MBM6955117.1 relaxase/mobilization nuclease domain-containing protein [Limosilactobacillus coleohominis]
MVVLESRACHSSYNRICYVLEGSAHNNSKTNQRALAVSGTNLNLLHDADGQISNVQSAPYLEEQFHQSLKKAYNPHRQYQCQSVVVSFSKNEFDTSDLAGQSRQALKLIQGFASQYFGDAQSVICVQCDGPGGLNDGDGKLHVHLIVNSVKRDGRTVATNRFSVFHLRKNLNTYMEENFEKATGREWKNPFSNNKTRHDVDKLVTKSAWNKRLKQTIDNVKSQVSNETDFKAVLQTYGITVTERQKGRAWTYHQVIKTAKGTKRLSVRDFYQRIDRQTGSVLSTRGLGVGYTKSALINYWEKQVEIESDYQPKSVNKNSKRKDDHNVREKSNDDIKRFEQEVNRQRRQQEHLRQHELATETEEINDERTTERKRQSRRQESRQCVNPNADPEASQSTSQQAGFEGIHGFNQADGPEPGE